MWKKIYVHSVRVAFGVAHSLVVVVFIREMWVGEPLLIKLIILIVGGSLMNCVWNFAWQLKKYY